MTGPAVTREDAFTAMRVLSTLAAQCAVRAAELAVHAAQLDPNNPHPEQHRNQVAGAMDGAREAAERATTLVAAVTMIAREAFTP